MRAPQTSAASAVPSLRTAAFALALTSIAALAAAIPAMAAACPQTEVDLSGYPFTMNAAVLDTAVVFSDTTVYSGAAYALVRGSLRIYKSPSPFSPTYVITGDAYDIAGVPPGTPVTVTAELVAREMASGPEPARLTR